MKLSLKNHWTLLIIIFLFLTAVRIPFYLTHHIQEDAYITLRCAENLAETGEYGFNAGERVSASTSHFYVFIAALIHLVAGRGAFLTAVLTINTLFFVAGAYFLARALSNSQKSTLVLWILISLLPVSLLISYSGMETSLLILMIGLSLYLIKENKLKWLAALCIALFPWIRPDAAAYALIIIFWDCICNKKINFVLLGGLLVGTASLLVFNQLYFGTILNQSIIAKAQARRAFSIDGFLSTLKIIFLDQSGGIFSPIRSRYLGRLGFVFLAVNLLAALWFIYRHRRDKFLLFGGLSLLSTMILVPMAYAAGGVIFQWYFWPVTFLGYALICAVFTDWLTSGSRSVRAGYVLAALVAAVGILAQWVYSYSWGMKEYAYRGGIGKQLAELAHEGDTLFLEPAGYIPFYSGLYTYDEAGLGSPLVMHYRNLYRTPWWMRFVEQVKPDWIVQRAQFAAFTTYQGYTLTEEEQGWFLENYHLEMIESYRPLDYSSNPLLQQILALGTADDYYIYEINR